MAKTPLVWTKYIPYPDDPRSKDYYYWIAGKYKIVPYDYYNGHWLPKRKKKYIPYCGHPTKPGNGIHGLGYIWGYHVTPTHPAYDTLNDAKRACKESES